MKETHLTVALGLPLHKSTQSKDLIELMSDLGLYIYDKIFKIENPIVNFVIQRIKENNSAHSF